MRVRYTLRAQADLSDIYTYLDERTPATALVVKSTIERRIRRLADFPYIAPMSAEPGIYELALVRYPYKMYYEISGDEVWIFHIRDTNRSSWIK